MKYDVYYNMCGVMPVHNFCETKEEADKMLAKCKAAGFSDAVINEL